MKTFCIKKNIRYREIKAKNPRINKFYLIDNPHHQPILAIPDGCVDLQWVWSGNQGALHLCGSFLKGKYSTVSEYDRCFGVKFNPGIIPKVGQFKSVDIIDKRLVLQSSPKSEVVGYLLGQNQSLKELITAFLDFYKELTYQEPNAIVDQLIKEIRETSGVIYIKELSQHVSYSQCYTDRIFKRNIGITLKKYAKIIRCQAAINYLQKDCENSIYNELAYYDQAHFINDFKHFTSYTPYYYKQNIDKLIIV